ncbi:hypothetical protein HYPBUDRAFT_210228 [Hyphopichia burtonii NRRL Y-1933]|uniref:Uncharacterized protein n=1 Tax=Hyphopichia burtonii NRRL Y-1933 TaxID=984485 RepID=A0A1E4RJB1_9ASCO|nr:hypothetical protein HYPBUDRAFT_210228 [Hyphopichia burtonii NRRL Y-1933]ODV67320.1 hypothetical protein HYPBUDRAFT_210228 [Hyphopichia burtonii NRRL Y-1933]
MDFNKGPYSSIHPPRSIDLPPYLVSGYRLVVVAECSSPGCIVRCFAESCARPGQILSSPGPHTTAFACAIAKCACALPHSNHSLVA